MARPKKVIEIEQKKGSLSLLEMVVVGIIVTVLGLIIWTVLFNNEASAIVENPVVKQETCPGGDGWVKVDNLDGLTYTYDVAEGMEVTDNCYKHATYVHYGTGDTVTADEHCGWEWTGRGLKWVCKAHELSHASFYLVPVPTSTPTPSPTPTNTPSPTPTNTPTPTPTMVYPAVGQEPPVTPTVTALPTEGPPFTPTATPTEVLGFGSANVDVLPETGTGGFGTILFAGFAVLGGLLGRVLLKK